MEFFNKSNLIRLRSHLDKYLLAEDDEKTVRQSRRESSNKLVWRVELVGDNTGLIRLKSLYNHYLTATEEPLLLGMTGKKVGQTDLSIASEWEPIRDGFQVKLRSRGGTFLRANGATKPWRNTVTHDTPHRTSVYNWILWDVLILDSASLETLNPALGDFGSSFSSMISEDDSMDSPASTWSIQSTHSPLNISTKKEQRMPLMESQSAKQLTNLEAKDSFHKGVHGRTIYYKVVDVNGNVEDSTEEESFSFKGYGLEELTHKLVEETGLDDIIVCTRSPLDDMLHPLRLRLPPNNTAMHVAVVPVSSRVARSFT